MCVTVFVVGMHMVVTDIVHISHKIMKKCMSDYLLYHSYVLVNPYKFRTL
jgi:hypothetical protein